jgi:hypothetical protein
MNESFSIGCEKSAYRLGQVPRSRDGKQRGGPWRQGPPHSLLAIKILLMSGPDDSGAFKPVIGGK